MKQVLVTLSFLFLVAAQHENEVEDNSYEAIRRSYSYLRATMAPAPASPMEGVTRELMAMMKKQCDEHGDADSFDRFQGTYIQYVQCIQSAVLSFDMPRSRDPATVIAGVCRVSPQILSCFHRFLDGAKGCMGGEERGRVNRTHTAVNELVSHLCFRSGQRIVNFIYNGGVNCVSDKKSELTGCLNNTMLKDQSEGSFALTNNEDHCKKVDALQSCMKDTLGQCPSPVAADFFDGVISTLKTTTC